MPSRAERAGPDRRRPPRHRDPRPVDARHRWTRHDRPHLPTQREQRLVERFTQLASAAIEHSRLYGALAESEERFRRAFEDTAVGMALTSFDGRFNKVNRALREMLGRSEEDLLTANLAALVHPDAPDATATRLRMLTAELHEPVQFETTLLRPDGAFVVVSSADLEPRRGS